jgi:hypothetical protein
LTKPITRQFRIDRDAQIRRPEQDQFDARRSARLQIGLHAREKRKRRLRLGCRDVRHDHHAHGAPRAVRTRIRT